jgi:hypothetical protein
MNSPGWAIGDVALVGGSSRAAGPAVEEFFGRPAYAGVDADEAIAISTVGFRPEGGTSDHPERRPGGPALPR